MILRKLFCGTLDAKSQHMRNKEIFFAHDEILQQNSGAAVSLSGGWEHSDHVSPPKLKPHLTITESIMMVPNPTCEQAGMGRYEILTI